MKTGNHVAGNGSVNSDSFLGSDKIQQQVGRIGLLLGRNVGTIVYDKVDTDYDRIDKSLKVGSPVKAYTITTMSVLMVEIEPAQLRGCYPVVKAKVLNNATQQTEFIEFNPGDYLSFDETMSNSEILKLINSNQTRKLHEIIFASPEMAAHAANIYNKNEYQRVFDIAERYGNLANTLKTIISVTDAPFEKD